MQIKELIFDTKDPMSQVESFVYEPSNVEEEKLGHLFIMGRIRNLERTSFYLINLLASRIKREYYLNPHRNPSLAFELSLKEANQVLKENEERINWFGNLDFFIAILLEKKLYFTFIGKIKVFILRGIEIIELTKDYTFNKNLLFPFSFVLEGNIKKGDSLIFSTSNVFSKEKLINLGEDLLSLEKKKLMKLIEDEEKGVALFINIEKEAKAVERIDTIFEKPKKVENIFKKLLPRIKKLTLFLSSLKGKISIMGEKWKEKIKPLVKIISLKKREKLKPELKPEEKKEKLSQIIPFKESLSKRLSFSPRKSLREYLEETRLDITSASLKKSSKKVIIGIIILMIGVVFLWFFNYQRNKEMKVVKEIITMVKNKKTEARNVLIYNDKEKALLLLSESLNLLEDIKAKIKEEEIKNLKKEIENEIIKISGKKVLSELTPIFEIKKEEKYKPERILLTKEEIHLFSTGSDLVYKWNLFKREGIFSKEKNNILVGTLLKEKPFYIFEPGPVIIGKKEKILPIELPSENFSLDEIDSFENYLYVFDKNQGEILKYKIEENEIILLGSWLKEEEKEKVKGAISIAIDGEIYLLFPNGDIKKFYKGKLKEEIKPQISPNIKNATKIFTSPENNFLYLLEPIQKRIIILEKNGNVKEQLEIPQCKNIKDFFPEKNDKKIYFLCENKVFEHAF